MGLADVYDESEDEVWDEIEVYRRRRKRPKKELITPTESDDIPSKNKINKTELIKKGAGAFVGTVKSGLRKYSEIQKEMKADQEK